MKKYAKVKRLLALALPILLLAACGTPAAGPVTDPPESDAPALPGLDFFGPESGYQIVRGDNAKQTEVDAFVRFLQAVKKYGAAPEVTTDWLARGKEAPAEEILFGNTNRPETAEALSMLEGAGYVICVRNRKLVLAATTDRALESAVTYFEEHCMGENMRFTEDFLVTGTETVPIPGVTVNGRKLNDFTIVAENPRTWELPIYTLINFFTKYCGINLNAVGAANAEAGPKIILGGKKADGSNYAPFETELYFAGGDLHLGCANPTMAQKVIYTLIDQYLDKAGSAELTFPEGEAVWHSEEGDNWDEADPKTFLTVQDRILRSCYKLQAILEVDLSKGISFTYENSGYKSTIAEARQTGVRCTNCVILGNWAMKDAGFYTSGIYNHTYDGSFGYTFSGGSSEFFKQNFEVIDVRDRNVNISTMWSKGELLPGDIIGYKDHNQTILPLGYAMDGGHGNCTTSGPGAPFARFVGPNPCKGTIVGFIFRANDAE